MKVAWLIYYPVFGGPHNRLFRLFPILEQQDIHCTAVLPAEKGNAVERLTNGHVPVVTTPLVRVRETLSPARHARHAAQFRSDVKRLRAILRHLEADVLLVGGLVNVQGQVAAKLEGVPICWQIVDSRTPAPVRRLMMPLVDHVADSVVFGAEMLMELHLHGRRLRPPSFICRPGVNVTSFIPSQERRTATRHALGIPENAAVVGTVANINPQKGIELFLRAAGRIRQQRPDCYFVIVGACSPGHAGYHASLRKEAELAGLGSDRLMVLGSRQDVESIYPALDVKLITSVPRSEGTTTTAMEAMACGVPVVASDVGGIGEVVQDLRTGYLVPPGDSEALADRALELLNSSALRARLGEAGEKRVRAEFTIERNAAVQIDALRAATTGIGQR